jgi:hypothetical protein
MTPTTTPSSARICSFGLMLIFTVPPIFRDAVCGAIADPPNFRSDGCMNGFFTLPVSAGVAGAVASVPFGAVGSSWLGVTVDVAAASGAAAFGTAAGAGREA